MLFLRLLASNKLFKTEHGLRSSNTQWVHFTDPYGKTLSLQGNVWSKSDFLRKFLSLFLFDLCLSWHLLCPYAEKAAKTQCQRDAELMMQETLA